MEQVVRTAVLVSGSGTNLQALIDAADPRVELDLVLSDRFDAGGLARAISAGIDTVVEAWGGDRDSFTERVVGRLLDRGIELVVLAGFMRILGKEAVEAFSGRIVNIHPSLLPSFPGSNAVSAALAHGVKVTGVTVHLVDEIVDHGPILAQEAVPVVDGDSVESLHKRIQAVEHRLYPRVVGELADRIAHGRSAVGL